MKARAHPQYRDQERQRQGLTAMHAEYRDQERQRQCFRALTGVALGAHRHQVLIVEQFGLRKPKGSAFIHRNDVANLHSAVTEAAHETGSLIAYQDGVALAGWNLRP